MQSHKYAHKFFVIPALVAAIAMLPMTGCKNKTSRGSQSSESTSVAAPSQESQSSESTSVAAPSQGSQNPESPAAAAPSQGSQNPESQAAAAPADNAPKGQPATAWIEPPIAKSLDGEFEFPHCKTMSISNGWHDCEEMDEHPGADCLLSPKFIDDLIARGVDVNQYNEYGQTPIMLVRDIDSVKKLLAAGANLHHKDDYEKTVLDYANSPELVDVLMQSGQLSAHDLQSDRMDDSLMAVRFYYGAFDAPGDDKQRKIQYGVIQTMDLRAAKRLLEKNWIDTQEFRSLFLQYAIRNKLENSFVLSLLQQGFSCNYYCEAGNDCKNETCVKDIADAGNVELMKYVIAHKLVTDKAVFTALLTAERTTEIADLLIQAGADIDSAYAATKDESFAQRLKAKGAKCPSSIRLSDVHNATAMHDALVQVTDAKEQLKDGSVLFSPNLELSPFKILVSAGANIHAVDKYGNTLLHHYNDDEYDDEDNAERIEILLKAGLSPKVVDKEQSTPLFHASPGIASLLIEAGTDVNALNSYGNSVVEYTFERAKGCEDDHCVEIMGDLLETFADAKARDLQKGSDFLKSHNFEDASELIDYVRRIGPNECVSEYYDYKRKVRTRNDSSLRTQLQNGYDPNQKDKDGRTPLFYVDYAKEARLLIAAGADVNVIDNEGNTPLLWIIHEKYDDVEEDLEEDEDSYYVNDDPDGLYECDDICRNNIVQALIAAGADTSIVNKKGKSAKEYL